MRDAYISDPVLARLGKEERYMVCVTFGFAQRQQDIITGTQDRIGFFYARPSQPIVEATKEQCGSAAYKPFPELEKLCQARKCRLVARDAGN